MDRRTLLKVGGMAAIGASFGGCAARRPARTVRPAPLHLPPVAASWDRVIRTTVGLRPHRPSGFLLKAEKLDAKTVIHNYGHGGGGMSLSWGTGHLAAELASQTGERRAAVLGCGAVGLAAARQLQRRGFEVTIYAMAVPPDTTSNMSTAFFAPASGLVQADRRTPAWDEMFMRAADIAYRQVQLLVGSSYGLSWIHTYGLTDEAPAPGPPGATSQALPNFQAPQAVLQPGEHPFPTRYAVQRPLLRIEPNVYLPAMMRDVLLFGGRIVIRKLDSPRDLMALDEPVIVNCTGLGAKALFGDEELIPVKGQLSVLIPQPEVNYGTNGGVRSAMGQTPGGIYMMPRSDGIVLGGTSQRGVATMEPSEDDRQRIVDGNVRLFDAMRAKKTSWTVGPSSI
jgi:D-amino-acid oxidase